MSGRKPKKKAVPAGNSSNRKGKAPSRETDSEALFDLAYATQDYAQRRALLLRVLELDPNHFEALTLLAQTGPNAKDALPYARRAFASMQAAVGDIQRFAGRMDESVLTVSYVTSRTILAAALIRTGEWDEGAKHAFELLDLGVIEEFGVHLMLLNEAIMKRRWDVADAVLLKCGEPNTGCKPYVRALLEFRQNGPSEAAVGHLRTGIAHNPHVIPILLDPENSPSLGGDFAEPIPGSAAEADDFAQNSHPAWKSVSGSLAWLRSAGLKLLPASLAHDVSGPIASKEEMVSLRQETKRLPRHQDKSWLVDVAEMSDGTWVLMVLDSVDLAPLLTEEFETKPPQDDILWHLYLCMVEPEDDSDPHRPAQIEFIREEVLAEFGSKLRSIGIDAAMREDAAELVDHYARMDRTQPLPDEPLTSLPQVERERWEIDWRQLTTWMTDDSGESIQPWLIMVVEPKSEMVLNVEPLTEEPTQEQIINAIRTAAFRPAVGEPHRPSSVRVASGDQQVVVVDWLRDEGIDCEVGRFKVLDAMVDDLAESIFGNQREGLTESEHIPLKLVGELYEHAAAYFRAAPWSWMTPMDLTELRCPSLSARTWIAVGMGQMGEGLGIMLFDNIKNLSKAMALDESDPDAVNGADFMQGVSISLEEKSSSAPADVAAAEQFGWPVAAADAWPVTARVRGKDGFETVNLEELQVIIAALQVVPKFWKGAVRGQVKPSDISLTIGGKSVIVKARQFSI